MQKGTRRAEEGVTASTKRRWCRAHLRGFLLLVDLVQLVRLPWHPTTRPRSAQRTHTYPSLVTILAYPTWDAVLLHKTDASFRIVFLQFTIQSVHKADEKVICDDYKAITDILTKDAAPG